jgi:hypothetical protein
MSEETVPVETATGNPHAPVTDIHLAWRMTREVFKALFALDAREDVDVVLVPFPVMTALKSHLRESGVDEDAIGKARVIRVADRVSKEIHIDRFCR